MYVKAQRKKLSSGLNDKHKKKKLRRDYFDGYYDCAVRHNFKGNWNLSADK